MTEDPATLLEGVLSSIEGSIAVGECHRFWLRYKEGDSLCGCGQKIGECPIWSRVDERLQNLSGYDYGAYWERVQWIQKHKNFTSIRKS